MSSQPSEPRNALLADLDVSIKKALDAKMHDLAGALFRIQGSAKGWCEKEDCGPCPLAPHTCVSGIEERVSEIIEKHHTSRRTITEKAEAPSKVIYKSNSRRLSKSESKAIPVDRYFTHLNQMLAAEKTRTYNEVAPHHTAGHRLRWQRVDNTFQQLATRAKRTQPH